MILHLLASTTGDPWIDSLLKGGPFALVLLLIIMDKIGTNGERDRLRVENADLRTEIRDLNKELRENIAPLLQSSNETLKIYADKLDRIPNTARKRSS